MADVDASILSLLECAAGGDRHIVSQAFVLSCGHSVCKKCTIDGFYHRITCAKCAQTNRFDFKGCTESQGIKTIIEMHLKELVQLVENRCTKVKSELESMLFIILSFKSIKKPSLS